MAFDAHSSAGPSTPAPIVEAPAAPAAPPVVDTPTPATTVTEPKFTPKVAEEPALAAVPEAFTPDWKFKVMDQEHEIPEFLRAGITDKEKLAQVRELHEKAQGLDIVKPKYQELKGSHQELQGNYHKVMSDIQEVKDVYASGDFGAFIKLLGVDEQKVLQWLADKAHYEELPPEQRYVLDQRKAAENRATVLEKEKAQYQTQFQEQAQQARGYQLQLTLEKPEVRTFAELFDSRTKSGSFREEVRKHGEMTWFASGGKTDLSPEQAVKEVMGHYEKLLSGGSQASAGATGVAASLPEKVVVAQKTTSTLPNVAGKANAPIGKPKPKSIDDLKKLYKQMSGAT